MLVALKSPPAYQPMSHPPASKEALSSSQSPVSVTSLAPVSTGTPHSSGNSRSPSVKPPNVFSNDGSFLSRIRRSLKEDEDKKKAQETLERKKNFADRFKQRGKRQLPTPEASSQSDGPQDDTPESEGSPQKKRKLADGGSDAKQKDATAKKDDEKQEDNSAQAKYHKAIDSYPSNLKDSGTGVRPLVK